MSNLWFFRLNKRAEQQRRRSSGDSRQSIGSTHSAASSASNSCVTAQCVSATSGQSSNRQLSAQSASEQRCSFVLTVSDACQFASATTSRDTRLQTADCQSAASNFCADHNAHFHAKHKLQDTTDEAGEQDSRQRARRRKRSPRKQLLSASQRSSLKSVTSSSSSSASVNNSDASNGAAGFARRPQQQLQPRERSCNSPTSGELTARQASTSRGEPQFGSADSLQERQRRFKQNYIEVMSSLRQKQAAASRQRHRPKHCDDKTSAEQDNDKQSDQLPENDTRENTARDSCKNANLVAQLATVRAPTVKIELASDETSATQAKPAALIDTCASSDCCVAVPSADCATERPSSFVCTAADSASALLSSQLQRNAEQSSVRDLSHAPTEQSFAGRRLRSDSEFRRGIHSQLIEGKVPPICQSLINAPSNNSNSKLSLAESVDNLAALIPR